MAWKCINGCEVTKLVICGGDFPWWDHMPDKFEDNAPSNIYFLADLDNNNLKELHQPSNGILPFELTDEDWQNMHDHADGGCCNEPQCPVCLEHLEHVP